MRKILDVITLPEIIRVMAGDWTSVQRIHPQIRKFFERELLKDDLSPQNTEKLADDLNTNIRGIFDAKNLTPELRESIRAGEHLQRLFRRFSRFLSRIFREFSDSFRLRYESSGRSRDTQTDRQSHSIGPVRSHSISNKSSSLLHQLQRVDRTNRRRISQSDEPVFFRRRTGRKLRVEVFTAGKAQFFEPGVFGDGNEYGDVIHHADVLFDTGQT